MGVGWQRRLTDSEVLMSVRGGMEAVHSVEKGSVKRGSDALLERLYHHRHVRTPRRRVRQLGVPFGRQAVQRIVHRVHVHVEVS